MTDIYLYSGASNPDDIVLRDPTKVNTLISKIAGVLYTSVNKVAGVALTVLKKIAGFF
jgi:hypothetical protein